MTTRAGREASMFSPTDFTARPTLATAMNWLGFLALIGCCGILISFYQLANRETTVMELYNTPVKVANTHQEIGQGQPLIYTLEYCKYVDASATMARELIAVDGRSLVVPLPVTSGDLPMGCHAVDIVEMIPAQIPSGTYRLRITRLYGSRMYVDAPRVFETEAFAIQ